MNIENLVSKLDENEIYTIIECKDITDDEYDRLRWVMESYGGRWNERCKGFKFNEFDDEKLKSIKADLSVGFVNLSEERELVRKMHSSQLL